jgi:hypothetical protein
VVRTTPVLRKHTSPISRQVKLSFLASDLCKFIHLHSASNSSYSAHDYIPSSEPQHAYSLPPVQPMTLNSNSNTRYASLNGAVGTYDPYQPDPPPSNNYVPASAPAFSSHDPYNAASTYDPYKPNSSTSKSYTSHSTPASSYDPYKPATHSRLVSQSHSTYSHPSNDKTQITSTYGTPSNQTTTPPTVTAAAYRPKLLNAYDPPLPPPKPKRAQPSWQRTQSPPALHNQGSYPSFGSPQSLDVKAPQLSPPHLRNNSDSYRSSSVDTPLPPPPARKPTRPPVGGVPNGGSHFEYSQLNGHHHHSVATDDTRSEREYMDTSSPPISHPESPPSANSYSHQTFTSEQTSREYSEDPEGGSMATAEDLPFEASSDDSLGAPWVSRTGTVTAYIARDNHSKSSVEPSAVQSAVESNRLDQHHSDELISAASSVPQTNSYDLYQPHELVPPPPRKEFQPLHGNQTSPPLNLVRTSSPASIHSQPSQYERRPPFHDQYARGNVKSVAHDPYVPSNRLRSASAGSILSLNPNSVDAYAPHNHLRQQSNESYDFGNYTSRYNYPERPPSTGSDRLGSQTILVASAYAPSPSLLGTDDPLGRAAARIPVFSFGFGGKVVTCFHGASVLNTGFDVALSSRQSRDIRIHLLHKIIPQSALEESTAVYPGPLFSDSGSPTVGLVRSGVSALTKSRKAKVIKYLEERIAELSRGIGYLSSGQLERGRAEGKLILVQLLKLMVENDGRLSGT